MLTLAPVRSFFVALSAPIRTGFGLAMMKAPMAAPKMMTNSSGCHKHVDVATGAHVAADDAGGDDNQTDDKQHSVLPNP